MDDSGVTFGWRRRYLRDLKAFCGESNARRAALRREDADSGQGGGYISLPGMPGLLAFASAAVLRDAQMTGTTRSSNGLDDRRKRLLFRCWHRGTREMDLILGRFADAEIGGLADLELTQLEELVALEDPNLYPAFVGETLLPEQFRTPLFERIKLFRNLDKPA
jgi:antitoxin CptB